MDFLFNFDEDIQSYFVEGQCGALAYELHKLRGWSLGLISDHPVGSQDYMGHLFVFDSEAMVIDIRGRRTLDEVKEEWYFCPYVHRFFSLQEFEHEMQGWDMNIRHDRDRKAKYWSKVILQELQDNLVSIS